MTASTQLRALEGEIAELENAPSSIRQFRKSKLCDKALTIAKELEKHVLSIDYSCEQLGERVEQLTIENQDLRAENATLKRRLDEAMKERDASDEHHRRYVNANLESRKQILGEQDRLRAENLALTAAPIEKAPMDGTRILALWPYSKSQCWFETFWDDDESQGDKPGWYAPEWGHLLDGYNPTLWMPLPPPHHRD